jgi:hypothetical protein
MSASSRNRSVVSVTLRLQGLSTGLIRRRGATATEKEKRSVRCFMFKQLGGELGTCVRLRVCVCVSMFLM